MSKNYHQKRLSFLKIIVFFVLWFNFCLVIKNTNICNSTLKADKKLAGA